MSWTSQKDEMQGSCKQRSESYNWYVDRAAKQMTQQFGFSYGRVSGSVRKQAVAVRRSA